MTECKLVDIKTITETVMTHGDKYMLVSFRFSNYDEIKNSPIADDCAPKMYGTIDHRFIDNNGCLKQSISLLTLWAGKTIADALNRREEYYKAKEAVEEYKRKGLI